MYKGKHLPKFGPYQAQRVEIRKAEAIASDLLADKPKAATPPTVVKIQSVQDQIGKGLPRIGDYNSLNNKQQV